jgi:tRNA-2-methylthio-N6-dimethylallyladenosine synthase
MADQVPKEVVQERFERLVALQNGIAFEENQKQIGTTVDVLVATNEGRKDAATRRLSGRSPDMRLVHFSWPEEVVPPRPGDVVTVTISDAAPFHVLADEPLGQPWSVRATRAGDAWDRAVAEACGTPQPGATSVSPTGGVAVSLGLPTRSV